MSNFILRISTQFLFCCVSIFCAFNLNGQNDSIIYNPCAVGGQKITQIADVFSSEDDVRHKPILISGVCTPSNRQYPYKVYWIKTNDLNELKITVEGDATVGVYRALEYDKNIACYGISIIMPNQSETLTIHEDEAFFAIVVHATQINQYDDFVIKFDQEVSLYYKDCFVVYDCIKDAYEQETSLPIFAPEIKDDVKFDFTDKTLANSFQKFITKTYQVGDKVIGQSEHPVFYKSLDFLPALLDIEVSCQQLGKLEPEALQPYLTNKLGDSLTFLSNYPYILSKNSPCTNLFYTYNDQYIDYPNVNLPLSIIRTYQILHWENGELLTRTQKISVIPDQAVSIEKLKKINGYAWNCNYQLDFPTPKLFSNCVPNINYLKLFDQDGKEYLKTDNKFGTTNLNIGQYKFYYIYDDYVNQPDTSILEVEVIKSNLFYDPYILYLEDNKPFQISEENFSNYITTHCFRYDKIKLLEEPITACDSLIDGTITLCCDMVQYPDKVTTCKIELKRLGLDSLDNIVVIDSTIVYPQIVVRQNITEIICPKDTILDCHTTDITPNYLGFPIVKGSCFDVQLENFSDNKIKVNDLKTIIYRSFKNITSNSDLPNCRQKIILECTTETSELSQEQTFHLMPNPVSELLTIVVPKTQHINHIEIASLTGHQVMSIEFFPNSKSVDVSNLQPGIYLIEFFNGKSMVGKNRFVKL
jgi:hypothetical protein